MVHYAFVKVKLDCKSAAGSMRVLVMATPRDPHVTAGWPSVDWEIIILYKIFRLQLFE